jgi:poly(hydroxyalkanoate) granule-associated protein
VSDEVVKAGRNVWLASLGALAMAEEEARGAFDRLVSRGEKVEKDENSTVNKVVGGATSRAKDVRAKVEDTVQKSVAGVLQRTGIPSRDEIRTLIARVEELNKKVEKLHKA